MTTPPGLLQHAPPRRKPEGAAFVTAMGWTGGKLTAMVEVLWLGPAPIVLRFQVLPDLQLAPLFDLGTADPEAVRLASNCLAAHVGQHHRDVAELLAAPGGSGGPPLRSPA